MAAPVNALEAVQMVNRLYTRLNARRSAVEEQNEYYLGKQPLRFATKEWADANAKRYEGFSDNWCRPVADAMNERIRHTGLRLRRPDLTPGERGSAFEVGRPKPSPEQVLFNEWWDLNELDTQSSQGFLSSINTARSFVLVWGTRADESEPIVTWERSDQCEIEYSWENRRERVAALKSWADEKLEYATLYTATEVWKFERDRVQAQDRRASQADQGIIRSAAEGGWRARQILGEIWPLRNPMGRVPMVEIPNRPLLGGNPLSEISGTMGLQDAANLLWGYLFHAADYASMDARVIFGPQPKIPILDDNGQKIGEREVRIEDVGGKRLILISDPNGKIDSFSAASLDGFTDVIEVIVGHIASQTRTPPTYLVSKTGMSNVNGEGLKAAEIGLVKKVSEFHLFASPEIREVYVLMALAAGRADMARAARLAKVGWANPEIRSEAQLADALLKKKQLGYPLEYLLELDGIEDSDIYRVLAMVEQERADTQVEVDLRDWQDPQPEGGDGDEYADAAGRGRPVPSAAQ